jgi:tRNA-splicing ligase RtcB
MPYVIKEKGLNIDCKVFLEKDQIDKGTMDQIKKMVAHHVFDNAKCRIMPDAHRSVGTCVGLTLELNGLVVPKFIGSDIGCGCLIYPIGNITKDFTLEEVEKIIKSSIPMGGLDNCVCAEPIATEEDIMAICTTAKTMAYEFVLAYKKKFNVDITQYVPDYSVTWLKEKCQTMGLDYKYMMRSLCTLGGGNHYLEVNVDKDDNKYIAIHCGSRSFGGYICELHQSKINDTKYFDKNEVNDELKNIERKYKDVKQKKIQTDLMYDRLREKKHADHLEGIEAFLYYFDMIFAQEFAKLNRRLILKEILKKLDKKYDEELIIESVHNYICFRDLILRKGSISAHKDELCIVSLNMRDGILLCKGKGCEDWNFSAPHGAGRKIPRGQMANKVTMKEFKASMDGIVSTTISTFTLDESPMAYKDSNMIIESSKDTVEILHQLKPIINVKAES